jgi:hypothetical protein
MTPEQKRLYTEMYRHLVAEIEGMDPVMAQQTVTRNVKLRQIASGFIIDEYGKTHDIVLPEHNPKIKFVHNYMEEKIDGKLALVALFNQSIENLLIGLSKYEPVVLRGKSMMTQTATEAKRAFNESEGCRIIILQADAAKYNHTLLGTKKSPCSNMLFYENSYSLDTRSQVEDRIHRWGQKYTCNYGDIVNSALDMQAIRALQRKEDVASAIMGFMRNKGVLFYKP